MPAETEPTDDGPPAEGRGEGANSSRCVGERSDGAEVRTVAADGGGTVEVVEPVPAEVRPDPLVWEDVHADRMYPATWTECRADRTGWKYGAVIYRALGFAMPRDAGGGMTKHEMKREMGSFARRWSDAMVAPITDATRLALAEAGIRKARAIEAKWRADAWGSGGGGESGEEAAGRPMNRGAVWNAWARKRLGKDITAAAEGARRGKRCKGAEAAGGEV